MQFLDILKSAKIVSIRARIFFLAGLGMIGMVALTGAYMLGEFQIDAAGHNEKMNSDLMLIADEIEGTTLQLRIDEKDYMLTSDKKFAVSYQEAATRFSDQVKSMAALPLSSTISEPIRHLEDAIARRTKTFNGAVALGFNTCLR